jgi:hypothetical protein
MDEDGSARRQRPSDWQTILVWPLLINPAAYRSLSVGANTRYGALVSEPEARAIRRCSPTPSRPEQTCSPLVSYLAIGVTSAAPSTRLAVQACLGTSLLSRHTGEGAHGYNGSRPSPGRRSITVPFSGTLRNVHLRDSPLGRHGVPPKPPEPRHMEATHLFSRQCLSFASPRCRSGHSPRPTKVTPSAPSIGQPSGGLTSLFQSKSVPRDRLGSMGMPSCGAGRDAEGPRN